MYAIATLFYVLKMCVNTTFMRMEKIILNSTWKFYLLYQVSYFIVPLVLTISQVQRTCLIEVTEAAFRSKIQPSAG
jgi:hypothetical protein